MSTPIWEVPFKLIGDAIVKGPEELAKLVTGAEAIKGDLDTDVSQLVQLLSDSAVAITDKGLNFTVDSAVARDFLTLLASVKLQLGIKAAAAAPAAK